MVNIEVEIVDANLDYNLLLGRNWIYEMDAIVSSLFLILCFPHEGRMVKFDQMDYSLGEFHESSESIAPLLDNPRQPIPYLGVGMYSSLMGNFDLPTLIASINDFSSSKVPSQREFFRTHYFSDPWPLPSSTTTLDEVKVGGMACATFATEISHQSIIDSADFDPTPFSIEELDGDVAMA